ncbi:MAG: hypothetical protein AAF611_15385 [Bacteroidota bacterium]
MKTKTNIKDIFIAIVLFVTLALPSCIQFLYQLEHDHTHVSHVHYEHNPEIEKHAFHAYKKVNDHIHGQTLHICHEQDDHLHEKCFNCDIFDFQLSSFIFEFRSHSETIVTPIISKITLGTTTPLCHNLTLTNTQLRAPPSVLS